MAVNNLQVHCSTLTLYCIYFLIINITPAKTYQILPPVFGKQPDRTIMNPARQSAPATAQEQKTDVDLKLFSG